MEHRLYVDDESVVSLAKWKVKNNSVVNPGTVICVLKRNDDSLINFKAKHFGMIKSLCLPELSKLNLNDILCIVSECEHEVVMKDLCAICGANLRREDGCPGERVAITEAKISMVHNIPELHVNEKTANQIALEDESHLLKNRKLVLLVDLDQTILHTTCLNVPPDLPEVHHFQLGQGPYTTWYHTKLRRYTHEVLTRLSELYEMHIVTFGNRLYAHTIAQFLDVGRKYFSHRILSRDEALDPLTKMANMKNLFPRGDSMVCIIDDRDEVWNFAPNLISVKPYRYFPETGDINAPPDMPQKVASPNPKDDVDYTSAEQTSSSGDNDRKSSLIPLEDTDDYLLQLESVLKRVHAEFYKDFDPSSLKPPRDIKELLPKIQSTILANCRIVFSGLVPLGKDASMCKIYRLAKQMGALIQDEIVKPKESEWTTHLVACTLDTQKVKTAKKLSKSASDDNKNCIRIVNPYWLMECFYNWKQMPETDYLLNENLNPEIFGCAKDLQKIRPKSKIHDDDQSVDSKRRKLSPDEKNSPQSSAVNEENEDDCVSVEDELAAHLPRKLPLDLAENPLMHMSAQTAEEMVEEVDDELSEVSSDSSEDKNYEYKHRNAFDVQTSDEDSLSADFPKGWSPHRLSKGSYNSDDGAADGAEDWTSCPRAGSDEVEDSIEWGACPEGYDYRDAEETRRLLKSVDESSNSSSDTSDDEGDSELDEADFDALKGFI